MMARNPHRLAIRFCIVTVWPVCSQKNRSPFFFVASFLPKKIDSVPIFSVVELLKRLGVDSCVFWIITTRVDLNKRNKHSLRCINTTLRPFGRNFTRDSRSKFHTRPQASGTHWKLRSIRRGETCAQILDFLDKAQALN